MRTLNLFFFMFLFINIWFDTGSGNTKSIFKMLKSKICLLTLFLCSSYLMSGYLLRFAGKVSKNLPLFDCFLNV